jgi:hypothetical protein
MFSTFLEPRGPRCRRIYSCLFVVKLKIQVIPRSSQGTLAWQDLSDSIILSPSLVSLLSCSHHSSQGKHQSITVTPLSMEGGFITATDHFPVSQKSRGAVVGIPLPGGSTDPQMQGMLSAGSQLSFSRYGPQPVGTAPPKGTSLSWSSPHPLVSSCKDTNAVFLPR